MKAAKQSLFERYVEASSDEREAIWQHASETDVSDEQHVEDLRRLANYFVCLVRKNAEQLAANLARLGYEFESPNPVVYVGLTEARRPNGVDALPHPIPILTREWYAQIGRLDFRQAEGQLNQDGILGGLGQNCPLYFLDLNGSLAMQGELSAEEDREGFQYWEGRPGRTGFFLPTGTWASNSEPKGTYLPDQSFDPSIYNEGAGWVTLGSELRSAFQWGGFPRWRRLASPSSRLKPTRPYPNFEELLPELLRGIVMI